MNFAIIGNCKTAALIDSEGVLVWCCLPNFDSPSVFAKILDEKIGGHFSIIPQKKAKISQTYLPQTNILRTEFDMGENAFAVIDFMPRYIESGKYHQPVEIHRLLQPIRGKPKIKISYQPRLNYARGENDLYVQHGCLVTSNELETIYLYSDILFQDIQEEKEITLEKDKFLILAYHEKFTHPNLYYSTELLNSTQSYWQAWSARCHLPKVYAEECLRSALTLKLLTYDPTGAIIAAATTSLPEIIEEERNWDYRFCWLRDSSLMLESLTLLGQFNEARRYINFLLRLFESKRSEIQIMYGIDGRTNLKEETLDHLSGYQNSKPVRIGNFAAQTKQNDIFGEVLNTIYLYYCYYKFETIPDEVWSLVKFLVKTTSREWASPDAGIWELRHIKEHFTFSKTLSWVALDRGIKIAHQFGKNEIAKKWEPIRQKIREDIEKYGWNEEKQAYTQSYGSSHLDASLLLMQHYGFLEKDDPRWVKTVKACEKSLVSNGYTFRYTNTDDFGQPKSAFIVASFWLTSALVSIGEKSKAKTMFENLLKHSNKLGLFSEDIDPRTGKLLGNFPQAYSHMALINAAFDLSQYE